MAEECPNKTTADNGKPKEFLTEGVLLVLAPALGFFFVYLHELAYCAAFSVPSTFVRPDVVTALGCATVAVVFIFVLIPSLDSLTRLGMAGRLLNLNPKSEFWRWPVVLFNRYGLVFLATTAVTAIVGGPLRGVLLAMAAYAVVDTMMAVVNVKPKESALSHLEATKGFALATGFDLVESRFGKRLGMLVALTVAGVVLALMRGNSAAKSTSEF